MSELGIKTRGYDSADILEEMNKSMADRDERQKEFEEKEKKSRLFGNFRKMLCPFDRVSIFTQDVVVSNSNYRFAKDIPDSYNKYYVLGVTITEEVFEVSDGCSSNRIQKNSDKYYMAHCIRIILGNEIQFDRGVIVV